MQNILLLGATGQVGQALRASLPAEYFLTAPMRAEVDFQQAGELAATVSAHRPALVINCVAYNQVDGAELDPALAMRINHSAVAELAEACAAHDIPLIHFSTDYVFPGRTVEDGALPALYTEADAVGPVNHYGRSKLAGEQAVAAVARNLVLRVSWVFSEFGTNMGSRIVQQAARGQTLAMACDQFGSPTYAGHIAEAVWLLAAELLNGTQGGLYHLSGTAAASRLELARALVGAATDAGIAAEGVSIKPVSQQQFAAQATSPIAPRPQWSPLCAAKLGERLGRTLPHWREGLARTVQGLKVRGL
ncbi:dTDP-4-dehydrorhamnose reductase [Simiduia sp. 21SJ11W-1]|uniref:dTDP-4-dehydrorhamnose reductase n=1 Tax=Simiduia sp. 21SJ11W-1 TaxID=2909669 RepID=UPI0020A11654|nr:dTDP-4-dehydrorhamnose reductase [Simiduia sp. 21SJ11W-1]UTA48140.1 dTDP-4-dehydrorhamnose reductase [Simiduia sp. 21SJ11W-1]